MGTFKDWLDKIDWQEERADKAVDDAADALKAVAHTARIICTVAAVIVLLLVLLLW